MQQLCASGVLQNAASSIFFVILQSQIIEIMDLLREKQRMERLHKVNAVFFYVVVLLGTFNIVWLIAKGYRLDEILFRGVQYVAMLIVMRLPKFLKFRLRIEVPLLLSTVIVVFCFSALVLGDGLDLYGRFRWWDKLLHAESGFVLSLAALWIIHLLMAENDKYIFFNKYFLSLFLIMFSLGFGALWEIVEYSYDSIAGTNTQQFMASTTGSIFTEQDVPLCGHAALGDTMGDLILDFAGAFLVSIYAFIRHDKIVERYKNASMFYNEIVDEGKV